MARKSFEAWLRDVDLHIGKICGLSHGDLPDQCYRDWHEDGVSALAAARRVIRYAQEN